MALSKNITEAEFELMLADVGVPVILGDIETSGLLDYDDQVIEGETGFASGLGAGTQKRGELVGRVIIVTVLTNDFPDGALAIDAEINVDGVDYAIRNALAHSHMALDLTSLYLRKN